MRSSEQAELVQYLIRTLLDSFFWRFGAPGVDPELSGGSTYHILSGLGIPQDPPGEAVGERDSTM